MSDVKSAKPVAFLRKTKQICPILKKQTPKQDEINAEIQDINFEITRLQSRQRSGLLTDDQSVQMNELFSRKTFLENELKTKIGGQERSQKFREKMKDKLKIIAEKFPDADNILKVHSAPGRPRIEEENPDLISIITEIATYGSAAQEKRQDSSLRSLKTLEQLTDELNKKGIKISKSATYLRILPRRIGSNESKRHIKTAPVKLIRATNDMHKKHPDTEFCTATIRHLEELASLLGPKEVVFLSQDDKARVALGVTAAKKQCSMLMHLEYRVTLPDHDWVVAAKHKLIPSVYALVNIKVNGAGNPSAVGYTGPTYIAIRSGKHSSSTAFSHALDFERMLKIEALTDFMMVGCNVKPILIITTDGGPDENPR